MKSVRMETMLAGRQDMELGAQMENTPTNWYFSSLRVLPASYTSKSTGIRDRSNLNRGQNFATSVAF